METKTQKLIDALVNGEKLTTKQITSRFNIPNPRATISNLRMREGYAVCTEQRVTNGKTVTKYYLGNPSREVIAAGYRALAAKNITA